MEVILPCCAAMTNDSTDSIPYYAQDILAPFLIDTQVQIQGESFRITRKGLVMDLDNLGEGEHGDYDPDDPDDTPFLRFSFYRKAEGNEEELMEIHDSSYCTLIDARLDLETRLACALAIFSEVYDAVGPYPDEYASGAKRTCEAMSAMCAEYIGGQVAALQAAKIQESLNRSMPGSPERKTGPRM